MASDDEFLAFLRFVEETPTPLMVRIISGSDANTSGNHQVAAVSDASGPATIREADNTSDLERGSQSEYLTTSSNSNNDSDLSVADTIGTTENGGAVDELIAQLDTNKSGRIIMSPKELKDFIAKVFLFKENEQREIGHRLVNERRTEIENDDDDVDDEDDDDISESSSDEEEKGGVKQPSTVILQMKSDESTISSLPSQDENDVGFRGVDVRNFGTKEKRVTAMSERSLPVSIAFNVTEDDSAQARAPADVNKLAYMEEGGLTSKILKSASYGNQEAGARVDVPTAKEETDKQTQPLPGTSNNPFADLLALREKGNPPATNTQSTENLYSDDDSPSKESKALLLAPVSVLPTIHEDSSHDSPTDDDETGEPPPTEVGNVPIFSVGSTHDTNVSLRSSLESQETEESNHSIIVGDAIGRSCHSGNTDGNEYAAALLVTKLLKQQRRDRLLLVFAFAVIIALGISLGILSSPSRKYVSGVTLLTSYPPSGSIIPSATPSFESSIVPSSSLSPSSFPSILRSYKISSQIQTIDLHLDDPYNPKVALDGRNMVIVVRDNSTSVTNTIFYSLVNNMWTIKNVFQEGNETLVYDVGISGKTAFVGIAGRGSASVFEQNDFELWEMVDQLEPDKSHDGHNASQHFGRFVDVDRDLACVGGGESVHLFYRLSKKWVHLESIDDVDQPEECIVAGHNIAVRGHDQYGNGTLHLFGLFDNGVLEVDHDGQDLDVFEPLQGPIFAEVSAMDMSNNHLVYWDLHENDAYILGQEAPNRTYTFLQQTNISTPGQHQVALGDGILVVGGCNVTYIILEQSGSWEIAFAMGQSFEKYQVSGRDVVATKQNNIYFFNVEDCAPTPTQMPSSSFAPTTCSCVEITSLQCSWDLRSNDDDVVLKSHKEYDMNESSTPFQESMCLQEGEYLFSVYCAGDGECQYTVTSNDALIAGSSEYSGDGEEISFSIPFIPAPSSSSPVGQLGSLSPAFDFKPAMSHSQAPSRSRPPAFRISSSPS
eukprot:CAMPEP_0183715014 /NCGR_PEP_ID=MMETSP0737-20130205/9391_1 /TAXON_ID=385413 /ORGANISM="Thalassiosira miniscula, Strain CCMP1093" /LENGTH=1000 /DNA_ID=CAMNT_0025944065 /DNA_START=55 /DNA_END=3054 /DNA_ORIENTATION=-